MKQLSLAGPSQLASAAHAAEEADIPAGAQMPAGSPPQAAVETAGSSCTPTAGVPERACLPSSTEQLGRASLPDSAGAWTPLEGVPERFEEPVPHHAVVQPSAEQPAGRRSKIGSAQQLPSQTGSALPAALLHSGEGSTGIPGLKEGAEAGTAAQPDHAAQADGRLAQAEQAGQSPADICGFFGAFASAPDVADTPTPASDKGEYAANEVCSLWHWPQRSHWGAANGLPVCMRAA